MVEKYIKIYTKRNIWLAFVCATIVAVPLFITSLFYDVLAYDILAALVPYPISAVVVLFCSLPISRFRRMIQKQEVLYGAEFNAVDVKRLETTLYISQDWLIWAGISAFHKKRVNSRTVATCVRRFSHTHSGGQPHRHGLEPQRSEGLLHPSDLSFRHYPSGL